MAKKEKEVEVVAVEAAPVEKKPPKVISIFKQLNLTLFPQQDAMVQTTGGKYERLITQTRVAAQFAKHVYVPKNEGELERIKGSDDYGKDYIALDDWKAMKSKDKERAKSFLNRVRRTLLFTMKREEADVALADLFEEELL